MNKVKIEVPNGEWGSLNTKYPSDSDRVADNEFTAGTANVDTSVKGVLTKRLGGIDYASLGGAAKDQYEAIFSDGVRHLLTVVGGTLKYSSGDGQVHNVISGLTATVNNEFATTQDRVYFGNGVQKKVYDRVTSYGGVTYTFPTQTIKNMGAIAPTTAPTAALVLDSTINQIPAGIHKYKVTFVYYDSEESNGGIASNSVTNDGTHTSNSLTSVPVGGYGVTARKIYRDDNNDLFYLVGVILNNTATTFTDNVKTPTTALPDDNSLPPDFTLINLYLDRLFLAGVPGDPYFIFYSEPGFPDIFPSTNYVPCNQEDPITGMVVYLDRLVVFNRRSMGQLLGRTSDQFRYAQIEGSVGCVDNRSIQIRVLNGVPVLIWLSDKGFYAYNGNSVVYISDKIEDQVNFNIQQSVIQKNKITHSDYTIFTQGTKTDGINLESAPGQITTKGPYWDTIAHPGASYEEQTNPKKLWDTEAEWEGGPVQNNLVTLSDATIKMPTRFAPTLAEGQLTNAYIDGTNLKLSVYGSTYTGESNNAQANKYRSVNVGGVAYTGVSYAIPIQVPRNGTLTSLFLSVGVSGSNFIAPSWKYKVWADSGGNTPGSELYASGTYSDSYGGLRAHSVTLAPNLTLTAGTRYWIGAERADSSTYMYAPGLPSYANGDLLGKINNSSIWYPLKPINTLNGMLAYTNGFNFTQNAIQKIGSWKSQIYDTKGTNVLAPTLIHTASYPSGSYPSGGYTTSGVSKIEASNDINMVTGVITEDINNLNGSQLSTLSNKRYWRVTLQLRTTDDRATPIIGTPILKFNTQSTWESEVIDCTSDVSSYQSLTTSKVEPSGTSVITEIATSTSNSGPWTFVSFGSHVVRQYVKLKLTLNSSTDNSLTPSISALEFKWIVGGATFISKSIDTGTTPSGWDIFQASFETNGGTISYFMRSATTEVGLSSASWYAVINGEFPTSSLPVNQWVQWRAIVTANPDQVPIIDSVTINWFVGSATQSIRCASIFYNTNYYLAAAEFGNTSNNLLFIFDQEGKWRVYRNLHVTTISYFFNNPYFCDAVTGKLVKFLQGTSDSGAAIPFEFRSKAFDFSADENFDDKIKILEKCILSGRNTGATYTVEYSTDDGDTFYPLKDKNGNSSFTTSEDDKGFYKWLRPDFTVNIPSGYSIMLRIYNNDTKEVEIDGFKLTAFVRKHDPID